MSLAYAVLFMAAFLVVASLATAAIGNRQPQRRQVVPPATGGFGANRGR